jgi:hypothetical protein
MRWRDADSVEEGRQSSLRYSLERLHGCSVSMRPRTDQGSGVAALGLIPEADPPAARLGI